MITVFDIPQRNYNNRTISTNMQRLGDHIGLTSYWYLMLRYEVFSLDVGTTITIAYSVYDGANNYLGGSTTVVNTIGKGEVGINRGDFDENAQFLFDIVISGGCNLSGTLYATEKGENIPIWRSVT